MHTRPRPSAIVLGSLSALSAALLALSSHASDGGGPCAKSALKAKQSCKQQAEADFWLTQAYCSTLSSAQERLECRKGAWETWSEDKQLCSEQLGARLELCEALGGGYYDPEIDPAEFVGVIDNPWRPFLPGTTYVYEKQTDEGLQRIEVIVTHETEEILGVTCAVVHDVETLDGVLIEDTFDWFAQDVAGNVWYFGELSFEYEEGELVGMSGSWKAGQGMAKPGIVMFAAPMTGETYRQEFLLGEAEDAATVAAIGESVDVPFGSFSDCLRTEEFTPLEPDALEFKYYAWGVGLVLEVKPESGERTELVAIERD
jgi:hypothetical protein